MNENTPAQDPAYLEYRRLIQTEAGQAVNRHLHSKMTWEQLEKMSQSDYAAIFLHNYYALGGEEAPENLKRAEAQSSLEYQTKQAIEQQEAAARNARLKDQHIEAAHLIFMGRPERMSAEERQVADTYAQITAAVLLPNVLDRLPGRVAFALSKLQRLSISTGRTVAKDLKEALAMEQVMAKPMGTTPPRMPPMSDTKSNLLAADGWVKRVQNVNGVEIHYVENTRTGEMLDFKFKD